MEHILYGRPVAAALTDELTSRAEVLRAVGITPALAIVRVGENGSDLSYEKGAMKRCGSIGISVRNVVLSADCTEAELIAEIEKINSDPSIHGCLLFRPLPAHIDEYRVCQTLAREKDMDCITNASLTKIFTDRGIGYAPCTAESALEILKYYGVDIAGKNATVIGRSLVSGKIVAMMLLSGNATVTMCHTWTQELVAMCKNADILVVAAGCAGLVTPEFTNPEQVIIDIGINVSADGKLCGDADYVAVEPLVNAITPVPGGVGAVTTAVLCKHVIEAAESVRHII